MCLMAVFACAATAAEVAGMAPARRPDAAPRIREVAPERQQRMQVGLPEKLDGLRFMRDQGNWYTPFDRRGMPPPYDLRGMHRKP